MWSSIVPVIPCYHPKYIPMYKSYQLQMTTSPFIAWKWSMLASFWLVDSLNSGFYCEQKLVTLEIYRLTYLLGSFHQYERWDFCLTWHAITSFQLIKHHKKCKVITSTVYRLLCYTQIFESRRNCVKICSSYWTWVMNIVKTSLEKPSTNTSSRESQNLPHWLVN